MAWEVPNLSFHIPQVDFVGYADRLMGSYDKGVQARREQDVLNGRRALGAEMGQAGATPNYQSMAQRLLGNGDLEGANAMLRLGQQEVQNNFERQRIDIMRQRAGKAEQPTYGLNPQTGVDQNGNPVLLQMGSDGTVRQSAMPPGVKLSNKPIQMDAGTHFVLIDPVTRQPIGTIPKDVAGAAQQKAVGTASGQAQAQMPAAEGMTKQIGDQIDALATDPYLPSMVGPLASRMPNISADAARVQSKMDQLQGGAFLQARQLLKGQGAITDFESKRAEAAYARLNAAQSIEDYKAALTEFKDALSAGLNKLRGQAAMVSGQPAGQPGQAGAPPATAGGQQPGAGPGAGGLVPGAVVNGFVYRGGNPKDPNSWGRTQ